MSGVTKALDNSASISESALETENYIGDGSWKPGKMEEHVLWVRGRGGVSLALLLLGCASLSLTSLSILIDNHNR